MGKVAVGRRCGGPTKRGGPCQKLLAKGARRCAYHGGPRAVGAGDARAGAKNGHAVQLGLYARYLTLRPGDHEALALAVDTDWGRGLAGEILLVRFLIGRYLEWVGVGRPEVTLEPVGPEGDLQLVETVALAEVNVDWADVLERVGRATDHLVYLLKAHQALTGESGDAASEQLAAAVELVRARLGVGRGGDGSGGGDGG